MLAVDWQLTLLTCFVIILGISVSGQTTALAQEYDERGAGAQAGGEIPDEVRRAAGALRRAVGETPVEGPIAPEDFAQLLWTDTARGDLAAGMALRAWVAAEYRQYYSTSLIIHK